MLSIKLIINKCARLSKLNAQNDWCNRDVRVFACNHTTRTYINRYRRNDSALAQRGQLIFVYFTFNSVSIIFHTEHGSYGWQCFRKIEREKRTQTRKAFFFIVFHLFLSQNTRASHLLLQILYKSLLAAAIYINTKKERTMSILFTIFFLYIFAASRLTAIIIIIIRCFLRISKALWERKCAKNKLKLISCIRWRVEADRVIVSISWVARKIIYRYYISKAQFELIIINVYLVRIMCI